MAEPARLDDEAVAGRLARLEETLERLERTPGPSGRTAMDAVTALAEVYGEALARVAGMAAADPALSRALTGDMLLSHLLVLHDLHPDPLDGRLRRALRDLDPHLRARGVEAALDGVRDGVARVVLTGGCASSLGPVRDLVTETLRAIAPELDAVEATRATTRPPAAFVSVEALFNRPAPAKGGGT